MLIRILPQNWHMLEKVGGLSFITATLVWNVSFLIKFQKEMCHDFKYFRQI